MCCMATQLVLPEKRMRVLVETVCALTLQFPYMQVM